MMLYAFGTAVNVSAAAEWKAVYYKKVGSELLRYLHILHKTKK